MDHFVLAIYILLLLLLKIITRKKMTETMGELMYIHCILYIYTVVSVYRPLELASYVVRILDLG